MKLSFLLSLIFVPFITFGQGDSYSDYPADDAHNHDGTHADGDKNCGGNYMLPGNVARLGSHSFMILGQEDENHILAEHRSGTPPHNYQFLFRIRLDPEEMSFYKKLLKESKTLPAFTTIYYKDDGEQFDRTFFCLQDLPKIFGDEKKKGDEFEKLFPIRASLLKNADHEGNFDVRKPFYPGGHFSLNREDVELIVYRYIPAYLDQTELRKAIKAKKDEILPLLSHAPAYSTEPVASASKRASFVRTDGEIEEKGGSCPRDFQLKKAPVPKTIHNFLLMMEMEKNSVLAVSYWDQAPHNYQTILKLKLTDEEMNIYRQAKKGSKAPPLYQTRIVASGKTPEKNFYFCMADLKQQISSEKFYVKGTVYKDSSLNEYRLGTPVGAIELNSSKVEILVNRPLVSLLNPLAVAKDVLGK